MDDLIDAVVSASYQMTCADFAAKRRPRDGSCPMLGRSVSAVGAPKLVPLSEELA